MIAINSAPNSIALKSHHKLSKVGCVHVYSLCPDLNHRTVSLIGLKRVFR